MLRVAPFAFGISVSSSRKSCRMQIGKQVHSRFCDLQIEIWILNLGA